jgi:hypothetical protein
MSKGHTFLFQEGPWEARGYYSDQEAGRYPVRGEVRITHEKNIWISDGILLVLATPASKISNRYEIVPFKKGQDYTNWKSVNPALGEFVGKFVVFDDSIISNYTSKNYEFSGSEFLLRVTGKHYWNRGVLFQGNQKLSSWALELRKVKEEK